MTKVNNIDLRIIFNSFGEKTIEAVINKSFPASSSGGISKSHHEARVIMPEEAIKNFSRIKDSFIGDFSQREFDSLLKKNINALGSLLTTSLSLAFFSLEFQERINEIKFFPNLLINVLGGGAHSFHNKPEIQEFLVIPTEKNIFDSVDRGVEIWHSVRAELNKKGILRGLNPECAWLSDITNEEALEIVSKIASNYNAKIGIDFAASSIFRNGKYVYHDKKLSREEQIDYVIELARNYDLVYIEDPLEENDFSGFKELEKKTKALICGDDIISTQIERLKRASFINAVIIKPNQAGTVTECMDIIEFSRKNRIVPIVSHRSTKTCCPSEARLALFSDMAKFSVAGIDTARCNELIRLWMQINNPEMRPLTFNKGEFCGR
ncbi:MAG: hypothetical protein QXQ40_00150 [Candidatus Aenigmatarchaeota archaeon]